MTFRLRLLHKGVSGGGGVGASTFVGVNGTDIAYFDGQRLLKNLIYGDAWQFKDSTHTLSNEYVPAANIDANGYVTSIASGYDMLERVLSEPTSPGSFIVTHNGAGSSANVSVGGPVSSVVATAGQTTFHWDTTYPSPAWATISYTFDAAHPITSITIHEVGADLSSPIDGVMKAAVTGLGVFRFMGYMNTNTNTGSYATLPTRTWTNRNKPNDGNFVGSLNEAGGGIPLAVGKDGLPVEHMVTFANEVGVDPWFTIGWTADDTYITNFATYVRDNIGAGRKVYAELSNEVWNPSYDAYHAANAEGISEGLPAFGLGGGEGQSRYAEKVIHVMDIWKSVFDATGKGSQLVRVFGSQLVQTIYAANLLPYTDGSHFPTALKTHIDAIAMAPYWGFSDFDDGSGLIYTGQSLDTIMDTILPAKLAATMAYVQAWKTLADSHGLRLIAYEGGQSVEFHNPTNLTLLTSIETDSRMYDLHMRFLQEWELSYGGDTFALTNIAQPITTSGAWGLVEYIGQTISLATTPKRKAVDDFIAGVRLPQTLTGTLTNAANSPNGSVVGIVSGQVRGSTLSIQSGGSGLSINGTTGAVTVTTTGSLPAAGSYSIVIRDTNPAFASGFHDTTLTWTVTAALNNLHAYRYYFFDFPTNSPNGDVWVRELEIIPVPGGSDTTFGQTITATSTGSGTAANAIDDNVSAWASTAVTSLKIDYGSSSANWIAANQFTMTVPNTATGVPEVVISGSDDGTTKTQLAHPTSINWASNLRQTFAV